MSRQFSETKVLKYLLTHKNIFKQQMLCFNHSIPPLLFHQCSPLMIVPSISVTFSIYKVFYVNLTNVKLFATFQLQSRQLAKYTSLIIIYGLVKYSLQKQFKGQTS